MAGNKEFNTNIDVKGKVNVTNLPNQTGVPMIWNPATGDISQRSISEFINDFGLEVKDHNHVKSDITDFKESDYLHTNTDPETKTGKLTLENDFEVQGLSNQDGVYKRHFNSYNDTALNVLNPKGGIKHFDGTTTGAIRISLPQFVYTSMISFNVRIFNYGTSPEPLSINISAYANSRNVNWVRESAFITGKDDLTVRFGDDGTNLYIYIGELDSSWFHLHVLISNLSVGLRDTGTQWAENWNISLVTAFDTVQVAKTNNFPYADFNKLKHLTAAPEQLVLGDGSGKSINDFQVAGDFLPRDGSLPMTGDLKFNHEDKIQFNSLYSNIEETTNDRLNIRGHNGIEFNTYDSNEGISKTPLKLHYNYSEFNGEVRGDLFINKNSSDSYMLLGGGGTKALSELSESGHNHDERYLHVNTYSPINGLLVQTDLNAGSSNMFYLDIRGNGYGGGKPIQINLEGYDYNTTSGIIQLEARAIGETFPIKVFRYNNRLCFWWEQTASYQSYSVFCNHTNGGNGQNRVVSNTRTVFPTTGVTALETIIPVVVWDESNLTNLSQLSNDLSYATESYVGNAISNLVDSSPATLNTLNELAEALGDDPNFATTVSNQIAERALKTTTISAGTGLTGGGSLEADRTLSFDTAWGDGRYYETHGGWKLYERVSYSDTNGTLIETDLPETETPGTMFELKINGQTYMSNPIEIYIAGHRKTAPNSTINAVYGISNDPNIVINVFYYNGSLCIWVSSAATSSTKRFRFTTSQSGTDFRIVNTSNSAMPITGVTSLVNVPLEINATQSWVTSQNYLTTETDPTVPSHVKSITTGDINNWNGKENAFTKNTAFNKNFGTTAGTVAEGNHTHSQYLTSTDFNGYATENWVTGNFLEDIGNYGGDVDSVTNAIGYINSTATNKPSWSTTDGAVISINGASNRQIWFGRLGQVGVRGGTADTPYAESWVQMATQDWSNSQFSLQNHTHSNLSTGTGLTGSTYNGGTARTFAFDTTWGDGRYVNKAGDTMTGSLTAPDFKGSSDKRLKENIIKLEPTKINSEYKNFNFIGKEEKRTGLIAQELEQYHPEFVSTDENGIKSISYIDLHSAEIAYLKAENEELKSRLERLEKLILK